MAIEHADLIAAEVDRAERDFPLVPGSDAALAFQALVGSDLLDIARARIARERGASQAA